MAYDPASWRAIWASLVASADAGDSTSRGYVELIQNTGRTTEESVCAFILWTACRGATVAQLERTEAHHTARAVLREIYRCISENSGDEAMSTSEQFDVLSIPSTGLMPPAGMVTVRLRDPFDNRFISFDMPSDSCAAHIAGAIGIQCTFANTLVYANLEDTMPASVLGEYCEMTSFEVLAQQGPLIFGMPELPVHIHDALFRSAERVTLRRGGLDDDGLKDYLIACHHTMSTSRVRPSRKVRVFVHTPLSEGSRPVKLSVDTSARLSWLHSRAIELYDLVPEFQERFELRRLRGNGALHPHGALRDIGYDPRLDVELYLRGIFGGGKRKASPLDESSVSSSMGANQEAYDEECAAAASSSAHQGGAFDEPPDSAAAPTATTPGPCPEGGRDKFDTMGFAADFDAAVQLGFIESSPRVATASSCAAAASSHTTATSMMPAPLADAGGGPEPQADGTTASASAAALEQQPNESQCTALEALEAAAQYDPSASLILERVRAAAITPFGQSRALARFLADPEETLIRVVLPDYVPAATSGMSSAAADTVAEV
jgi:hypothetical protein